MKLEHRALAVGLLLGALVFAADLLTPLGVAVGVFYVAVVPVALFSGRRNHALILTLLTSALIVLAFFGKTQAAISMPLAYANRGFSLVAVWTVAALVFRHLAAADDLARARRARRALSAVARGCAGRDAGHR